jgi:60 kDa SS-A/Ro ribonucleoprotein
MIYRQHFSTTQTPQSEAIPGTSQVPNSAGGYAWALDDWGRLDRFLILGSEGGTYYVSEHKLTRDNAEAVLRCIQADGLRVVARIQELTYRAPKNDPCLFALAMCSALGDKHTRRQALAVLPEVARTGTHLFHFAEYVRGFRGWGRALRDGVAKWYDGKTPDQLAYQLIKYRQRDGWTHRDLLRLSHPKAHQSLYGWVTQGKSCDHPLVAAYDAAQKATDAREIMGLIEAHGLPWEALDTKWLKERAVWEALLPGMPLMAMVRNLNRMTACGLLVPLSGAVTTVCDKLEGVRKARVHPYAVLLALKTYARGHGFRGSMTWEPVSAVVDALDAAFYTAFGNVTPTNKRIVLALDVSGSMDGPMGNSPLTVREGAAAMALITKRVEPHCEIVAFSHQMVPVTISERERLDDVVNKTRAIPMGGTDCALPMMWALGFSGQGDRWYGNTSYRKTRNSVIGADAFIIYTDNETWAGSIHPAQALRRYRDTTSIPAKLAVVGMTATEFTIADPNDAGMLDVVGFDAAAPQLIADFVAAER